MKKQNKLIYFVLAGIALLAAGVIITFTIGSSDEQSQLKTNSETTANKSATESETDTTKALDATVSNEAPSENPPFQGDVTNQPAYLVKAETIKDKNYIGVDYVIVFQGEEAIQAQIEDGLCTQASECKNNPNGYIRNKNSHYRTYEISTTTPLTIEAQGAIKSAFESQGVNTTSPTFDDLKLALPTLPPYASTTFPFKEAKTFVYIDIIGGGVTKISEPN